MKKPILFTAVFLVAVAVAVIFYLNRPGPAPTQTDTVSKPTGSMNPSKDLGADRKERKKSLRPERQTIKVPKGASREEKLEVFMSNAGVKDAFNALETGFKELSKMLEDGEMSPEEKEMFNKMQEQFDAKQMSADYQEMLDENFSDDDLSVLNEIYQDPDVQRVVELGGAFGSDPERMQEVADFIQDFKPESLPPQKLEALEDFAEQQLKALPKDALQDAPPEFREEMNKMLKEQMIATGAAMFQDSSSEEIERVVGLLSNPVAEKETSLRARFIFDKAMGIQNAM